MLLMLMLNALVKPALIRSGMSLARKEKGNCPLLIRSPIKYYSPACLNCKFSYLNFNFQTLTEFSTFGKSSQSCFFID